MRQLPPARSAISILGTAAILLGAIVLAFLLGRGLSRPLKAITEVMNRLSSGNTDVTIPGSERRDELGTMAKAVDVFRRQHDRGAQLARDAGSRQGAGRLEKQVLQRQMADRFETDVKGVVAAVAQATTDMQRVAGEITSSVNGTSERAAAAPPLPTKRRAASTPLPRRPKNSPPR